MATDNHIKKFSAADIEKYHRGLLSAKERHDLEKAALDDPFLADALEGYAVAGVGLQADLAELKQRLGERTEEKKSVPMNSRKTFAPLLRIAAMIIVIAGAGMLVYQFAFNKKEDHVAQVNPSPAEKDTGLVRPPITNSTPVNTSTETKPPITSGSVTVKEKAKTSNPEPVIAGKDSKTTPVTENSNAQGETKVDDRSVVSNEVKAAPAGGAPVATTVITPKKTAERDVLAASSANDEKESAAREESKTRSLARKKDADNDVARNQAYQQPDDSKNRRAVTSNRQAEDGLDFYSKRGTTHTFRGRVTDASNIGLPFANVTNTRDNVGTYTDANGNFVLTSTDSVLDVQVRSLGYDINSTQLRNDLASNKVVMREDNQVLSEVVVSNQKPNAAARSMDGNRKLVEPEPVDGWVKYDSYLANNLNLPEDYKPQPANNTNYVQVSFEVDKNGEPVSIRIEKSLCPSCDEEAKRLVKDGPKFRRNANKKGRTTVTINF